MYYPMGFGTCWAQKGTPVSVPCSRRLCQISRANWLLLSGGVARIISTAAGTVMASDSPFMDMTAVSHWPKLWAPSAAGLYCRVPSPQVQPLEYHPQLGVAGPAVPNEILAAGVLLESIEVSHFDVSGATAKSTSWLARRRAGGGTVPESPMVNWRASLRHFPPYCRAWVSPGRCPPLRQ
jgi:hypothetical protein